jgi:2-keto-3-deoxy-L-rhamnonate aldolase RhmA
MSIIPNHTKRQLQAGKLALGIGVRLSRTVDIAQIAKTCGFDWLFIDAEHSAIDLDTAAQISSAAVGTGITPLVRVAGMEHHHSTRVLDNGAQGVVIPHVDTAEQARRIASFTRFPPIGHRSIGGAMPQTRFEALPIGETMRLCNEETLVVCMVETPAAVENCDAMAAVPGIDVLLIGTNDLCAEMGIPGKFDDPRVVDAYTRVIAACKKHGKFAGMGGVYTPDLMKKYIAMGMQFILSGADLSFMMAAARERATLLRGLETR